MILEGTGKCDEVGWDQGPGDSSVDDHDDVLLVRSIGLTEEDVAGHKGVVDISQDGGVADGGREGRRELDGELPVHLCEVGFQERLRTYFLYWGRRGNCGKGVESGGVVGGGQGLLKG